MAINNVETYQRNSEVAPVVIVGADNSVFANLAATLAEIKKLKGVSGYILRSNKAAVFDLVTKESVNQYALLASEIHDCSREISKQFKLTDVESALVEGRTAKVLCMCIGENRLAVFMDKTCSHAWIVKRILI